MTDAQQREAARQFFYKWNGIGREDEDARSYWIDVLQEILGVEKVTDRVDFEKKVLDKGSTRRIDVYIPETRVLIEQKSLGIPLDKPQAGHDGMTPYEQAKHYDDLLPVQEKARWIVVSNFAEIWIYDMSVMQPKPSIITLSDLQSKYHMLDFLVNKEAKTITIEMKLSLQAGELVGKIYDAFLKQYKNPDDPETLKSLNKLCVRIVFCLYAEDAAVFGKKSMFHDYMSQFDAAHARKGLRDLFRVLNQKPEERDEYLADDDPLLAAFPYVNGGLFADDDISIPPFTDEIMNLILRKASDDFDWSGISPTIFGAVFESTLNPETRRSGGMHYTSIENIHKVIDPLFLDDLKAELDAIEKIDIVRTREQKLRAFQDKLASIVCLDPAAGSGNFLTEGYLQLRKLENQVINDLSGGQVVMGLAANPIKVQISQFYGIEINDFAVTVARTALWIAENQMMKETEDIVHMSLDFLPLKTNANIVEGNALRIDWESVVPKSRLMYIMGNPPFVGYFMQTAEQKAELTQLYTDENGKIYKDCGKIDYVNGWYMKAAKYIHSTDIEVAFVSTNSITQGTQACAAWEPLYRQFPIHINFAYRTFVWNSEAKLKAAVHCVIIGFSEKERAAKYLYEDDSKQQVRIINQYLIEYPPMFITSRSKPICNVLEMSSGGKPVEGGNLIFTDDEKAEFILKEPGSERFFKRFIGSEDFINDNIRWCLWLLSASPKEIRDLPLVKDRVESVRQFRLSSKKAATNKAAEYPQRFVEIKETGKHFVAIPEVSSSRRRYIPIGYLDDNFILSNGIRFIPDAPLYVLGLLTSNVHMAWVRSVCGRLKSDYDYSVNVVYNNFPWPELTEKAKEEIGKTAQAILDARSLYPDSSLADLYDPSLMPPELRKAHQANDAAVMKAYGMPIKETDEAACVAWLMRLYQEKVAGKAE